MKLAPAAALAAYHAHLTSHDDRNPVIMDLVHAELIGASVRAHKPAKILELGIGTGFVTKVLALACAANGHGVVTSVDNAHDWGGAAPDHFRALEDLGVSVILADEGEFLEHDDGRYDLIVCDGDHTRTHEHAPLIFARANEGALLFFHDTASPQFPNLRDLVATARAQGFPHTEFNASTLPHERAERGLLMVINRRGHTWKTPWTLRLRHTLGRLRRRIS